ncbi:MULTISPECIES: type II toxin-antitoxin system YafO family toxin [unclassified Modicisalibacter]|uniref:type II toxin-antitoxin system YafO family toxin n=1 Tax=unclassified Modicisalibacter TaxID=2679913 RepID=UPI001CC9E3F5|nr:MULTISPECIES: type II toxin-antitoxin system YafO family toxin [unclassified Modicisalibacter]MBZ9558738.1 type II toxin-antitoxin system YafO family toxin [Modicisalibacter sp. R2A 31.J]MBZ9575371.1 type II toxin-antitoxin system YafO family toxin [Modicisalibacter sp. MOD 31.J]
MANVHFHEQSEYLFDEVDRQYPGFKQELVADFKACVESFFDYRPPRFGKFDLYTRPPSLRGLEIWHIHICMPPKAGFPAHLEQQRMKCDARYPERDAALVYVQGLLDEDEYCLLAMLYPHAHEKANDERRMLWIADMARDFRDRY